MRNIIPLGAAALFLAAGCSAMPDGSIVAKTEKAKSELPICTRPIGTAAIYEPERKWWKDLGLESPQALLKVLVGRSGCFTVVDRGEAFTAAMQERQLAEQGDLRQSSNVGKGQLAAADYVIVPDIPSKNPDANKLRIGALIGGLVGGQAGWLISKLEVTNSAADVVLTVTDVRSSQQVLAQEGHASQSDVGFGSGGGWSTGAAGISTYQQTQIGQVVSLAFIDAYTKTVMQLGAISDHPSQDNAVQSVTTAKPGRLYDKPGGEALLNFETGTTLHPTGNRDGIWWEVADDLGHKGWVSSVLLKLEK